MAKVNVNAEMRHACLGAPAAALAEADDAIPRIQDRAVAAWHWPPQTS